MGNGDEGARRKALCRAPEWAPLIPIPYSLFPPFGYSIPFVDGTAPPARGARATAMRNARANALNTVSA